jgi:inner membrane protein
MQPGPPPWWRGHLMRVCVIGGLILLLQIPIALIAGLVGERQDRRDEAAAEIAQKWGAEQHVVGPWLSVPYRHTVTELDQNGDAREAVHTGSVTFAPSKLDVDGDLSVETRYRGIFEVPVYRSAMHFSGSFERPSSTAVDSLAPAGATVEWHKATLTLLVSDVRTIHGRAALEWNGDELAFEPGSGHGDAGRPGIHVPIGNHLDAESFEFGFELALDGTGAISVAPVADETRISLRSDWDAPSFQGAWLPTQREVSDDGFSANWELSALSRGYPGAWLQDSETRHLVEQNLVVVALLTPVDHYRMSERSVKYELLFLTLVFATVWLFEVKANLRVHPIQYLLVGLASCTFYLLELALSEHLGFSGAYLIAATLVVAMLGMYGAAVLRRGWRGILLSGASAALYSYLYVVLLNEDYALLAGALAVFGALAVVMGLTYRIDWYGSRRPEPSTGDGRAEGFESGAGLG